MRLDLVPSPPPAPAPSAPSDKPADRATTFQAVEGGEVHSGQVLLVEAYVAIWLFLLAFIALSWRKQARLHARLDDLERVVDLAAARLEATAAKKPPSAKVTAAAAEAEGPATAEGA